MIWQISDDNLEQLKFKKITTTVWCNPIRNMFISKYLLKFNEAIALFNFKVINERFCVRLNSSGFLNYSGALFLSDLYFRYKTSSKMDPSKQSICFAIDNWWLQIILWCQQKSRYFFWSWMVAAWYCNTVVLPLGGNQRLWYFILLKVSWCWCRHCSYDSMDKSSSSCEITLNIMQRKHCLEKWNMKDLHIFILALSFWFISLSTGSYINTMSTDGYTSKPDNFHSWLVIMRMDWLWNWWIRLILLQWNLSVLCMAWSCFWNLRWFIVRWT